MHRFVLQRGKFHSPRVRHGVCANLIRFQVVSWLDWIILGIICTEVCIVRYVITRHAFSSAQWVEWSQNGGSKGAFSSRRKPGGSLDGRTETSTDDRRSKAVIPRTPGRWNSKLRIVLVQHHLIIGFKINKNKQTPPYHHNNRLHFWPLYPCHFRL